MNSVAELSHVVLDTFGRAWIDGSNIKVLEIVRDHLAYGWSPEEIHWQHPHITLAQVYGALAYYHDNRASMDAEIRNSLESADAAARFFNESPLANRLHRFLTESK